MNVKNLNGERLLNKLVRKKIIADYVHVSNK